MRYLIAIFLSLFAFTAHAQNIQRDGMRLTHPRHISPPPMVYDKLPTPEFTGRGGVVLTINETFIDWVQRSGFTQEQRDRNRKLSAACGSSNFKPVVPRMLRVVFADAVHEMALGWGYNLKDRVNLRQANKIYIFRNADTTNCWVIEIPNPKMQQ